MARFTISGRIFLLSVLFFLGLGRDLSMGADSRRPPNILFILTDDQSYRTLSCYRPDGAYDWVQTPNIDRLASRGVRFSRAYLGSWCLPSRYTILTGRQPYAIQSIRPGLVYPKNTYDPKRVTFWPKIFREHGYYTGMIGKWHTGTDTGFGRDWDFQIAWNRPGGTRANASAYYKPQYLNFNGAKKPVLVEGYPADNYTGWAVNFIKDRAKADGQPWALWLCYPNAHPPFTPSPEHQSEYPGVKVVAPPDIFQAAPGKPGYVQRLRVWLPNRNGEPMMKKVKTPTAGGAALKGDTLSDWARQYQQCVSSLDEAVGKIAAALEASGQEKETLVIFTADQGFALGQHGFAHKLAPYDANIASPLIISRPGSLPMGKVCRTPVGGVDLVATLYAQAGIQPPVPLDGHDLSPLLENPGSRSWDHPVVQTFTRLAFGQRTGQVWRSRPIVGPPVPWWTSVVHGDYKYVRTMVRGELEELYDLRNDPEELHNLVLSPGTGPLLETMRSSLHQELVRTGAPFADRMPAVGKPQQAQQIKAVPPVKASRPVPKPLVASGRAPKPADLGPLRMLARGPKPGSKPPVAKSGRPKSIGWKS